MNVDTLVVGGGLAGVTTFHELVSRGVEAALVEKASEVALGASYANGSMLTPSMSDPWNSPGVGGHLLASLFDPGSAMKLRLGSAPGLARWGVEFLRNSTPARHAAATRANFHLAEFSLIHTRGLVRRLGIAMDGNDKGTMALFASETAMLAPIARARMLAEFGFDFLLLDAAQAVRLEPQLADVAGRIAGAIQYPNDGVGDARKFTQQVAASARQAGGSLLFGTSVSAIDARRGGGFDIRSSQGPLVARRIVLAAGSATPRLARPFGVRLPIKPAKGYSLTYDMSGAAEQPAIAVVDDAMHAAVVPIGERIRVAGTAEFAGDDARIDPRRVDNLARLFERLYPKLASQLDRTRAEGWAGLRPMSADGRPFIGETHIPGLWINAGHGHLGWTMAVGSARLLTQLMLDGAGEIEAAPFAVGRKRR